MSKKDIAAEIVEVRAKNNYRGVDQYLKDCRRLARLPLKKLLMIYAEEVLQ